MSLNSKWAFFIIVGVICSIFTFIVKDKKNYFLFLTILFAPLSNGIIFYHYNGIMLMDFPLIILLVLALFSSKRFKLFIPQVSLPAVCIIFWDLISALVAIEPGWVISELTRIIRAYLIFICIVNLVKTKKQLQLVLTALLATFSFECAIGIYQWRWGPLGLKIFEEVGYRWRAAATFCHPAIFGDYLILLLPLIFRLFLFYRPKDKQMTILYGVLFFSGTMALFGSYARGPWISLIAAMGIMLFLSIFRKRFHPKVRGAFVVVMLFACIFIIHYYPAIRLQFSPQRKRAVDIRMPLNRVALRLIKDRPVLGTGLGNYSLISPKYVIPEKGFAPRHLAQPVHNSYLLIAAETGLPGLFFFLWFVSSLVKRGFRVIRFQNFYISNISIGILTGYLAIFIAFLAGPDYSNHQILMMFWILGGLLVALSRIRVVPLIQRVKNLPYKQKISLAETSIYINRKNGRS